MKRLIFKLSKYIFLTFILFFLTLGLNSIAEKYNYSQRNYTYTEVELPKLNFVIEFENWLNKLK